MNTSYHRPADTWSPLHFLASLGAGGLAVTFFIFLMFWVPHPAQPVPVFEDIIQAFSNGAFPMKLTIILAVTGIAGFAFVNIKMLVWNLKRFFEFRKTENYMALINSNGQTQLLAMTVNAGFIVGLVFVPGLWSAVEYLFPLALIAFALIAALAFRQIGAFLGRVLSEGGVFDVTAHNSYAQVLTAFALSMTAVCMSAPAAMSTVPVTVGISLIASMMLGTVAGLYALIASITAFNSMLHHGTAKESAPTLMVVVPILTILGITTMRQEHGLHTTFGAHGGTADNLLLTSLAIASQVAMIVLVFLLNHRHFAGRARTQPVAAE